MKYMKYLLAVMLVASFTAEAYLSAPAGSSSAVNSSGVASQNLTPAGAETVGTVGSPWASGYFGNVFASTRYYFPSSKGTIAYQYTRPSGGDPDVAIVANYGSTMSIFTDSNATNDGTATTGLTIETGNKSSGTGNSGSIIMQTGTSAGGTRGVVDLNALVVRIITTTSKPTCSSTYRGGLYYTQGAGGTTDKLEVCAKDTADVYAWKEVPNAGSWHTFHLLIATTCSSSPCTITRQGPTNWVDEVTGSGGNYQLDISDGIFSAAPVCQISGYLDPTSNLVCSLWGTTASGPQQFYCITPTTGAQTSARMHITCSGPR